jgi:hypothetical protein
MLRLGVVCLLICMLSGCEIYQTEEPSVSTVHTSCDILKDQTINSKSSSDESAKIKNQVYKDLSDRVCHETGIYRGRMAQPIRPSERMPDDFCYLKKDIDHPVDGQNTCPITKNGVPAISCILKVRVWCGLYASTLGKCHPPKMPANCCVSPYKTDDVTYCS